MDDLQTLLVQFGAPLVFLNVLLEQAGLPIPAYPLLIVAGALAAQGQLSWTLVLLATVAASLLADTVWYLAGRRHGYRLLSLICRISLSQDSCIRQSQTRYQQIGTRVLLVAKFLPGAGALSTVLAGLTRAPYRQFAFYDVAGTLIWAGSAVLLGAIFHPIVATIIQAIDEYGWVGFAFLASLLALYVLYRLVQRVRITRFLRAIPRLPVDQLAEWNESGRRHVVLDVRAAPAPDPLPGSIPVDLKTPLASLDLGAEDTDIVVYCSCPNEISAALLAMKLRAAGYKHTWALLGGHDAWLAYREQPDSIMTHSLPEQQA